MTALLETTNLTKIYSHDMIAVDNLTLSIGRGRIIGLLGPNGSGKSTLIKMINGLLTPTAGTIQINGSAPGIESKKCIAYLPERTYLQSNMKVSQLIDFFGDFYDNFQKDKAYAMLQSMDIKSNAQLYTLSKGTKEKVQLILVMSRNADLYILDEPLAGVDPASRDYILKTIIRNYNENATVIISTHLISDIENILDDVILIQGGRIKAQTTVEDIRSNYGKSVDAYFREVFAC